MQKSLLLALGLVMSSTAFAQKDATFLPSKSLAIEKSLQVKGIARQATSMKKAPAAVTDDELVTPPEGLTTAEYTLAYKNSKGNDASTAVFVGFDGNDVYIQGFDSYLPKTWMKGTLEGSTVTFKGDQYFGKYFSYGIYLQQADAVFAYDSETGTLSAEGLVYTYSGNNYADYYMNPVLTKLIEKAATPASPEITMFDNSDEGWYMLFNIPTVDINGEDIMSSKLSYQVFVDINKEISALTFTSATHTKLTEDLTVIPYTFSDNYDIFNNQIFFNGLYSPTWNKIGIQSIYTGGGEENKSEILWYTIRDYDEDFPEGLVFEEYVMTYTDYNKNTSAAPMKVGIAGSTIYIQGFDSNLPEKYIKGTIEGTTATFKGNQYIGLAGTSYEIYLQEQDVVFNYDSETGTLSAEGLVYTYTGQQYASYYVDPVLTKVIEKAATPATPTITKVEDSNYGYYISFNIPTVDTEGNGVLASKLSYQLFVDIDHEVSPLTFTPATHMKLTEDMTVIPYGFTESYDFYSNEIFLNDLFSESWNKIGIQSIYTGGGEENKSNIGWYDIVAAGIQDVKATNDKAAVFNLAGQKVSDIQKGLYIVNGKKVVIVK